MGYDVFMEIELQQPHETTVNPLTAIRNTVQKEIAGPIKGLATLPRPAKFALILLTPYVIGYSARAFTQTFILHSHQTAKATHVAPAKPKITDRFKDPSKRPFAESPWPHNEWRESVTWDAADQQWRCAIGDSSTVPCSDAAGKTEDQLVGEKVKSDEVTHEMHADRAAKDDYWCGFGENPKKDHCNTRF